MVLRSRIVSKAASKGRFLLIPVCVAIAFNATANEIDLPLLKEAKALQCATTQPAAKAALTRFWEVQGDTLLTPVEEGRALESGTLHAATLDIILKTLVGTAERYPDLRNQVERTMLQWNYCDTFSDGTFYDIKHANGLTIRSKASYVAPEAWQGFKKLGFLGETESRFIPDIISSDQNSLRMDFEQLFHRIYREQCFPHPDTAELFDTTEFALADKVTSAIADENEEYPHYWESECLYPTEVPLLEAQLLLENVPLPVPELASSFKLMDVPQLVPGLNTDVKLLPVEQLVPGLKTDVKIEVMDIAIPVLQSRVEIVPVPVDVPKLEASLKIIPVAVDIPKLATLVELVDVPVDIPVLESILELVPIPVDIPVLQTTLEIVEQPLDIPVLISSVEFDQAKPKVFTRPVAKPLPAPVVVASNGRGVGGYAGSGGYSGGYGGPAVTTIAPRPVAVQPVVVAPKRVAVQPVIQQAVVAAPVIQSRPTIIVDKNASLLERLLSGLNNGTNVLVIDKIQLTVNEYNGNVETAISSSDVGTNSVVSALDNAALIKELVKFTTQKAAPIPQPVVEKKQRYVEKKNVEQKVKPKQQAKPKAVKQYIKVPALESILLVSPTITRPLPKRVVISKPKYSTVKVPRLKTQLAIKAKPKKKTYKAPKKKKKITSSKSGNSSVFIYKPYKDGDSPTADEKSVEQLLQEYADYEARRKSGRSAKKKIKSNTTKKIDPTSKGSSDSSVKPKTYTKSKTSTKSYTEKPQKTKQVSKAKESKKEPEIALVSKAPKPENKVKFAFANAVPDYTDVEQVTAVPTNAPSGLSGDAPLPYVIEENFINDHLSDKEKKALKSKKPEKKPIGLAGNVYLKKSLGSGKWGIGGSINRKIIKDDYWFARVGWSYSLEDEEEPFSYSWGIGYSDWHSGTFSAQLNNWGPIKPGEGLALDKAIASFGYSVKSELLKKYRLSLSGALNVPIDGNTSAAVNMRWSPFENWYINASVSQPLEGDGDPKWSYGFGYSDWRPNKFNLQYSNYGPNDLFYHNYQTNGTWSLSYNYKF